MKKSIAGSLLWIEQIVRKIIEVTGIVAVVILLALMMMTVSDVFLRFFFNSPIPGSAEYTTYMMVGTGFLGLAWCALGDGHINVDLIASKLSKRGLAITDGINYVLAIGISLLIGVQSFYEAAFVKRYNVISSITGVPIHPFYWVVAVGFLLLVLAVLILLVDSVRRIKK